jgi:hypothetical protein
MSTSISMIQRLLTNRSEKFFLPTTADSAPLLVDADPRTKTGPSMTVDPNTRVRVITLTRSTGQPNELAFLAALNYRLSLSLLESRFDDTAPVTKAPVEHRNIPEPVTSGPNRSADIQRARRRTRLRREVRLGSARTARSGGMKEANRAQRAGVILLAQASGRVSLRKRNRVRGTASDAHQ